jgi:L-alanine-DL-glutamate epimerase-like enolase superfamily enzyme
MKLSKLQIAEYRQPFKVGFHSPQTHRRAAESIFLQFFFSNGCKAFGECAPRSYVTGESCHSVINVIQEVAAPLLFDADLESIEDVVAIIEKIERQCLSRGKNRFLSALAAIELALLDALGKRNRTHIANIIGRHPYGDVSRSVSIPFLPTDLIEKLFGRLQHLISIDSVKVLMKNDLQENLRRVSFVRSLIGSDMPIRIEANGKWSFQEALEQIEKLSVYDVVAIEEPIRAATPERLFQLRKRIDIEIILDESICSIDDAERMIMAQACDGLNLKLSKCGGLLKLMTIADYAQKNNLKCQLGTHVGEGPILDAAGLFAAYSHSVFNNYEGYSSLLFLDLNQEHEGLRGMKSKPLFQGPGLGVPIQSLSQIFDSSQAIEIKSTFG